MDEAADGNDAAPWLRLSARMGLDGAAGPFTLNVDLDVEKGAFVAIIGSSGAGKTTLLRILAGLMSPDRGHVRVGSSVWCDSARKSVLPVRRRSIGFVFQDYALFPNMSVQRNVEYAIGRGFRAGDVRQLLELVGLQGLAGAYPARLSGGQKQRLALIRALARRPDVLMLDEPLSALDPVMRTQLQDELKRLHGAFGTTTFMVSHDTSEILRLADRVIRLENGRIAADGSPASVLGAPPSGEGVCLTGHHVDGPDDAGFATVRINGELCRIRYRGDASGISPGAMITLRMSEAAVQSADRKPASQAGEIVTFTSRGGA